jgi:hypothetical protein
MKAPLRAATLVALAFAGAAPATSHAVETSVSCEDLKLAQAECLPGGPDHAYVFGGFCTFSITEKGGAFSKSYASHKPFPVEVVARWKAQEKTLREVLQVQGGFEWNGQVVGGELETVYVCSEDPVIGTAACNVKQHTNDTGLAGLSVASQAFTPITHGRTTLAEAAKLSTSASCASKGPTPPPPPPAVKKQAPALKTPKKVTPRLPAPAASGGGSSQVVVPAAGGARVPERRPVTGRARMPDPTKNPGRRQVPDRTTNPGPPNVPCTERLRLAPGERIALAGGRSLDAPAGRAAGSATSRVRLLDGNGRPLREFDAAEVCADGHGRVYATIGNRAQPLGRLARVGQ